MAIGLDWGIGFRGKVLRHLSASRLNTLALHDLTLHNAPLSYGSHRLPAQELANRLTPLDGNAA
jgi:hypothetical protein